MSDLVTAVIAPQPASFNPSAPLVELETQLRTAVACADASNKTAAALILHMVEQRKQTVRSIAKTVGKSVGWVHGMLVWARADYVGDPFGGPVRKAAREAAAVFSQAEQPVKLQINGQSVNTDAFSEAAKKQIEDVIAKLPPSWESPRPPDESAENRKAEYAAMELEQASTEKSLADRLNEICNTAWSICQDKSNWSPALTEHELLRVGKHMDAMRSSFHSLSKIAKKASERQAKKANGEKGTRH